MATTKEKDWADLIEDDRWHDRQLVMSPVLAGSKRAIKTPQAIWISPAMYDLIVNARTLDEMRTVLSSIEVVEMPEFTAYSAYVVKHGSVISIPREADRP